MTAFAHAAFRKGPAAGVDALVAVLAIALELPTEAQAAVLDAMLAARAGLMDDGQRSDADLLLDRMIGEAAVGPQRMFVRDHLVAGGFERP